MGLRYLDYRKFRIANAYRAVGKGGNIWVPLTIPTFPGLPGEAGDDIESDYAITDTVSSVTPTSDTSYVE